MKKKKKITEIATDIEKLINACKLHDEFLISSKAERSLNEHGVWADSNAFNTHLELLNDIGKCMTINEWLTDDFIIWLQKQTTIINTSKEDVPFFSDIFDRINSVISQGYGDKLIAPAMSVRRTDPRD